MFFLAVDANAEEVTATVKDAVGCAGSQQNETRGKLCHQNLLLI